jgi:hypothetical protein
MILGLPINSAPICGMVSSTGWRDSIGEAVGIQPPPPPDMPMDHEDKKMTGVHSGWLTANHNTSPEGDLDAVVQRYALSCVWHMFDE